MKKLVLSVFAVAVLGLSWVHDVFGAITCRNNSTGARSCSSSSTCPSGWTRISSTCSKTTVGGNITYISHHDQVIKCTWEEFQGDWAADPTEVMVSQSVEGVGNYATCSGWDSNTPVGNLPPASLHSLAPFGFGRFFFNIAYQSTDSSVRTCSNTFPGTELTYRYFCVAGVSNQGRLTLAPVIFAGENGIADTTACNLALNGCDDVQVVTVGSNMLTPDMVVVDPGADGILQTAPQGDDFMQVAPAFTGGCSPERVAAGKCTMVLGGIPADSAACSEAFPEANVPNSFNTTQMQTLAENELLFYKEVASEGQCGPDQLPTVAGLPAAAYGRYCQSDLGLFSDNTDDNYFPSDPKETEGFDNELRVCPTGPPGTTPHTASHDVEQVALTGNVRLEPQGPLSVNCTSGGNTDSGKYKVLIPQQAPLLAVDIDTIPLNEHAPKLEGVSPMKTEIKTNKGVRTLELTYPTCNSPEGGLSGAVIANNPGLKNHQNVTLHLVGQTNDKGLGPVLFQGEITIKVNGVKNK